MTYTDKIFQEMRDLKLRIEACACSGDKDIYEEEFADLVDKWLELKDIELKELVDD